jgi:hypothetical protein
MRVHIRFWLLLGIYLVLTIGAAEYNYVYDKIYTLILNSNLLDTTTKIEHFAAFMKTVSMPWWWQDALFVGLLYILVLRLLLLISEVRHRWELPVVSNKVDKADS